MYRHFFKRFFDFVCSGMGLIVLFPIMLVFTPIVAIAMRGNPFFMQKRPGKDGKVFTMIKYRTMSNKRDSEGELLSDEVRLTKFGKIMRSLSIDELPELINIFLGQMSIIGPRPLRVEYLSRYNAFQARRHEVRPGLTGLSQVEGRNNTTWDDRFAKDVEYVDNLSLKLDIKIFFKTIIKVLKRDGISQEGNATMQFFMGNETGDMDNNNSYSAGSIIIDVDPNEIEEVAADDIPQDNHNGV